MAIMKPYFDKINELFDIIIASHAKFFNHLQELEKNTGNLQSIFDKI